MKCSKIDTSIYFSEESVVISLVRHNEHAVIILESIGVSGNHELFKIHFTPKDANYCLFYGADFQQIFGDKIYEGKVDKISFAHENKSVDECNREDVFSKLKLSYESNSWKTLRSNINVFMQSVEYERLIKSPKFNIKGAISGDDTVYNCCTWAIKKLALIPGVDATEHLKCGMVCYYIRLPNH